MIDLENLSRGKLVSFEQLMNILPGCHIEDMEATYYGDDPEAICMKVRTADDEEKYFEFGSDSTGSATDLTIERLEENSFYVLIKEKMELTLEDLKYWRMELAKRAMKYKQLDIMTRDREMEFFGTAPKADAYKFYFHACMITVNALNKVIREREEFNDGEV